MKFLVIAFLLLFNLPVLAGGFVDDNVRFIFKKGYTEVKAGNYHHFELPGNKEQYEVKVEVHNRKFNDVDAYVCDENGFNQFRSRQPFRCYGVNRGRGVFSFKAPAKSGGRFYFVLNNSFSMILKKKVSYEIAVVDRISYPVKQSLLKLVDGFSQAFQKAFDVPEFDISIKSCGQVNAFARLDTGDITVCSELVFQELQRNRKGALIGIILHEVGHSLLSLWNIPGNANEELVDEFAVVMMHMTGQQGIAYQLTEYFSEANSKAEAINKIYVDDRHPLSPQRVRNIKRILNNPGPIVERWSQILYPRMTVEGLKELLKTSPTFANRQLANQIINEKSSLSNNTQRVPPPPRNLK